MAKRKKPRDEPEDDFADLVCHPRFGKTSQPSRKAIPEVVLRKEVPGYQLYGQRIFPASAIPADIERQNYSVFPLRYYVDQLHTCRTCGRRFIFFAREQQYWYEDLGFSIEARAVNCIECRKSDQTQRRRFQRYSRLIPRNDLTDEELATLTLDAVFLWREGLLRNEQKLRTIRNQARRRLGARQALARIDELVAELDARETPPAEQ